MPLPTPKWLCGHAYHNSPWSFYDMGVLKEIGNAIGPVLRINAITDSYTRGRYARIYVQVDLAKPLVRKVLIGIFGELGKTSDDVGKPYGSTPEEVGKVKDEYGPWMLVERRKQGSRQGPTHPNHPKLSIAQVGAFNGKDMGRHLHSRLSVIPPSSPPSTSLEGKHKSVGFNPTSSASLPTPPKEDQNVFHTPSPSGEVLSQFPTNPNHSNHKAKNGSKGKGKGKGKLQQQSH
nr:hypothetical protein CFP56_14216 [Quercus suber]